MHYSEGFLQQEWALIPNKWSYCELTAWPCHLPTQGKRNQTFLLSFSVGIFTEGKHASLLHSCYCPLHPTWWLLVVWKSIVQVRAVVERIFLRLLLEHCLKINKSINSLHKTGTVMTKASEDYTQDISLTRQLSTCRSKQILQKGRFT